MQNMYYPEWEEAMHQECRTRFRQEDVGYGVSGPRGMEEGSDQSLQPQHGEQICVAQCRRGVTRVCYVGEQICVAQCRPRGMEEGSDQSLQPQHGEQSRVSQCNPEVLDGETLTCSWYSPRKNVLR
jgi:hypothetical protein